jgi:hypothetical protein
LKPLQPCTFRGAKNSLNDKKKKVDRNFYEGLKSFKEIFYQSTENSLRLSNSCDELKSRDEKICMFKNLGKNLILL